jgi:hypothetical protein
LREDRIWDEFTLRIPDHKATIFSCNTLYFFVVTTTDNNVIISEGLGSVTLLQGRQIVIDVDNRKASLEDFVANDKDSAFQKRSEEEIRSSWQKHNPIVTSQLPPNARYVTHRSFVPSSRSGFWTDFQSGRRDNSNPYDVVNWETVNQRGIVGFI